jgi:hypothetical protein
VVRCAGKTAFCLTFSHGAVIFAVVVCVSFLCSYMCSFRYSGVAVPRRRERLPNTVLNWSHTHAFICKYNGLCGRVNIGVGVGCRRRESEEKKGFFGKFVHKESSAALYSDPGRRSSSRFCFPFVVSVSSHTFPHPVFLLLFVVAVGACVGAGDLQLADKAIWRL